MRLLDGLSKSGQQQWHAFTYRRRWKIERSIGWVQNFRRLVTRYEYYTHLFHGFVQLACLIVVMRRF